VHSWAPSKEVLQGSYRTTKFNLGWGSAPADPAVIGAYSAPQSPDPLAGFGESGKESRKGGRRERRKVEGREQGKK